MISLGEYNHDHLIALVLSNEVPDATTVVNWYGVVVDFNVESDSFFIAGSYVNSSSVVSSDSYLE